VRILSIITSGLGGTHLITQGYGYSIIVVPVVRGGVIRPEVIYVTRKYKFPVFQLDVLSELLEKEAELNTLDILKFKILKKRCNSLDIVLPKSLGVLIDDLSLIQEEGVNVNVNKLLAVRKIEIKESVSELKSLSDENKEIFMLSKLELIKELTTSILMQIPEDLHIANIKKKAEYLELLDLLDQLDEQ